MRQHLTPLLGSRRQFSTTLVLLGDADRLDCFGFVSRQGATQSRQAKRHATGVVTLTRAMTLGDPKERFDCIRTDRHPNIVESQCRGRLKLVPEVGVKLATHCGRGYLGDEIDRKSTRLNSSHVRISYAVFCLKTKKHTSELH